MWVCERTSKPEMSRSSGASDRHGGMHARGGEHAEYGQHERAGGEGTGPSCDPRTGLVRGAIDGQVGEESVEFAVRPSCEQDVEPFFKLARTEPPLDHCMPQLLSDLLSIGI